MNILAAIVSGIVGTIVLSLVLVMAPKMGMPKMDIVGMLGTMFSKVGNPILGWGAHFMMGIVFALVYAFLWSSGIGSATVVSGLVFGALHWLIVGLMMGAIPMMHAGIKAGTVPEPGIYMSKQGGMKAFLGGLMGHMIFGLVVVLVYSVF